MPSLLILGAGEAQRPVFEAARRRGLVVAAADPDPRAPCLALADHALTVDLAQTEALLAFAMRHRVHGVVTFAADYPMPALGAIVSALGLPGPGREAVHRATHKGAMRRALRQAGVPCPDALQADGETAALDAAARLGGDLIVKPVCSSGGRGVTQVHADAGPLAILQAYRHAVQGAAGGSSVMVERFVDGPEYSVEMLCHAEEAWVVAITEKLTSGAPHHVELGHRQPAPLSDRLRECIHGVATATARALGIRAAAAHLELKLTSDGPQVIECAARAGGGFIAGRLVPLTTGVDYAGACVDLALGRSPTHAQAPAVPAAAVRFLVAAAGRVRAIHGLDAARNQPGIVQVGLSVEPGVVVPPLTDARGRCGHVVAIGPHVDDALARCDAAAATLRFEMEPAGR